MRDHAVEDLGPHFKLGIYSDTHHGSDFAADDEREQFYGFCHREGVERLLHCGDATAGNGVYPGQIMELRRDCIGATEQIERAAADFIKADLPIDFILGNHDEAWFKRAGLDTGREIENAVARMGSTHPITCVGHGSARILIGKEPNQCIIDLLHPSGGTAYAVSYRPQKVAESYTGGDKPHIICLGHFHKAEALPHLRNMVVIQPGCFEWQTPYMRRKPIEAHVAGCVIEGWMAELNGKASLTRLRIEYLKFYAAMTGAG